MTLRLSHSLLIFSALLSCGEVRADVPASKARMLQQLEQSDWIQQAEALQFLAAHRVAEAAPRVRELLEEEQASLWIRGRALVALADIEGKIDLSRFGLFVGHQEPLVRAAAAEVLARHGGTAGEVWLTILLKDEAAMVRLRAAAGYARRLGAKAWEAVEPLTREPDPEHLESAARALAWTSTEPALQRLAAIAAEPKYRASAVRGITGVPTPGLLPILLELLAVLDPTDNLHGAVLTALQNHEWQAVISAMRKALESKREEMTRAVATVIIVLTRSPELGDPLRDALTTATEVDTLTRGLTALGTKAMQADRYHELFSTHLSHQDENVRSLAIRCLAHCENVNLWTKLGPSVSDSTPYVIRVALEALLSAPLAHAPRGGLVQFLKSPLSHPDEELRELAYKLLGHAGSEADFRPAFALLRELLQGTNHELRAAAAKALGQIAPLDQLDRIATSQGYLANWKVIGTFLNDEKNSGFEEKFPPEDGIDFDATYLAKYVWIVDGRRRKQDEEAIEREIKWSEAVVDQTDGRLILSAHVPPPGSHAVGYAVADFRIASPGEVILDIDGDDAFRVWVNGTLVTEKVAPFLTRQDCVVDSYGHKLQLVNGANRIVVKSANIDHKWWVRLRLTDPGGKPIEILAP